MENLSIKKNLARIILFEVRQLILIMSLLLALVYKHFQPAEFTGCAATLERAFKFCTVKSFSLWELVNNLGKLQLEISKILIIIAAVGWFIYFCLLFLITGLKANQDRYQPLLTGVAKATVLCANLVLIYNLLILLFNNRNFPHFPFLWLDIMFWWTFGCYCIHFLFYIFENRKGLTDGNKKNIETRSN